MQNISSLFPSEVIEEKHYAINKIFNLYINKEKNQNFNDENFVKCLNC